MADVHRGLRRSALLCALFVASTARAEERPARDPDEHVTVPWLVAQLVPSPEWAFSTDADVHFGLRWQVTPVLWSWGVNRRVTPWRFLVSDPFARQSGSMELFFSPELLRADLLWRTGIRSYFPVLARGEYLSVSLGASHAYFESRSAAAIEAGAYVLFGVLGAQVTWSPTMESTRWIATLRVRYF